MKKDFPIGLRVDDVRVTDAGLAAHFSARNVSMPATPEETCSSGQH
jgi:hypothetical protein